MDKKLIEEIRMVAEFDGWESNRYDNLPNKMHRSNAAGEFGLPISEMKYHTSWDWLMPVVAKIAAIPSIAISIESFTVENGDRMVCSCGIKRTFWPRHAVCEKEQITYCREFTDKLPAIQNVWQTVVQFLQWYNQQPK